MTRVLLTGAGGFVGRAVRRALEARGASVHSGPRRNLLDAGERATLIREAGAEVLIHLAWITAHGSYWQSPENSGWEAASRDLFRRFAASGGRRIVGIGTCAEYDWSTGAPTFPESAPLAPRTAYGAAKARTGEALMELAALSGTSAAWARLFFLFGPGEPQARLIPLMIRAAREGIPLDCGPAGTVRDFWHVDRCGEALAALAMSELTGPVNVAGGAGSTFGEIGRTIEAAFRRRDILNFGARTLGPGEPPRIVADTTRLGALQLPAADLRADLADYCHSE